MLNSTRYVHILLPWSPMPPVPLMLPILLLPLGFIVFLPFQPCQHRTALLNHLQIHLCHALFMCPGPRHPMLHCRAGRGGMEKWQSYGQDTFANCAGQSHTPPTTMHPVTEPVDSKVSPKTPCFPSCFYSFSLHGTSFSFTSILAANPDLFCSIWLIRPRSRVLQIFATNRP